MANENLYLAGNISDSRKKLGLSQEALAEKANVPILPWSKKAIGSIEEAKKEAQKLFTELSCDCVDRRMIKVCK